MKLKQLLCRHKKQKAVCVDIIHQMQCITCICEKCETEFKYSVTEMQNINLFTKTKIDISSKIWDEIIDAWTIIDKENEKVSGGVNVKD